MLYECYINKILRSTLKKGYGYGKSILVAPEFALGASWAALTSGGKQERVLHMYREEIVPASEGLYFLGFRFNTGSIEEAVCGIVAEARRNFKCVVTPNVRHGGERQDDPATMQPLYEQAWRVFCDSRVLSRLARFGGRTFPVIPSSDLTAHLIARAAELRLKIAIIGPTVASCAVLMEKYPGLDFVVHTPPIGFIKSEHEIKRCLEFVAENQASLIFIGVGMLEILAPAEQISPRLRGRVMHRCLDRLPHRKAEAGASLGAKGLEWLHRPLSDPRRLASRYLIDRLWRH